MDADAGTSDGVSYEKIGQQREKRAEPRRSSLSHSSIELDREGHSSRSAMWEGWANLDSNLGLDVIWSRPVTIMYDRKYR